MALLLDTILYAQSNHLVDTTFTVTIHLVLRFPQQLLHLDSKHGKSKFSLSHFSQFYFALCLFSFYNSVANCQKRSDPLTQVQEAKLDPSTTRPYLVKWQSTEYTSLIKQLWCSEKSYPKYGSTFFAKTQDTSLLPLPDFKVGGRNFLSCFSENETVVTAAGLTVLIRNLNAGDKVFAADDMGGIVVADVVAVPHASNKEPHKEMVTFMHIEADNGLRIAVTSDHLLLTGKCNQEMAFTLLPARSIAVGSCVVTVHGLRRVVAVRVSHTKSAYYSVVTTSEYIVVSGFIASPFSWSHSIGRSFYFLPKQFHRICPECMSSRIVQWWSRGLNLFAHLMSNI